MKSGDWEMEIAEHGKDAPPGRSYETLNPKPSPISLRTLSSSPLVSILVASYNYARFLPEALGSLLAQTYDRFEVIVCDDGSTDASVGIVESFAARDARIRLIRQPNGGVGQALNTAYAASTGEIVCLLDADDYFMPGKLRRVVDRMAAPGTGFVLHAMHVVDAEGRVMRQIPPQDQWEEGWLADRLVRRGGRWRSMPASALVFHRDVADLLFPMPSASLRSLADAYLYMLAPSFTEIGFIPEPLAAYRLHGANLTGAAKFGLEESRKWVEGMERVHRSIRQKIEDEAYAVQPLSLENHLTYSEHRFMQHLFDGERRSVLGARFARLASSILKDDLYGWPRKMAGLLALGGAVLLPAARRAPWIAWVLGRHR